MANRELGRVAAARLAEVQDKMDGFFSKSNMTEKDVEKHSRIVNEKVWQRHKQKLGL
ncbi:MAG: hypothetical protein V1708_05790 [Candidatus Micrarchaeota archaeon]